MTTPRDANRSVTVPCTITVEHTNESLEAHVELDGGLLPTVGDRILVHGGHVAVPFGERIVLRRDATLTRAGALEKAWVRFMAWLEFSELYEVSFSPGRL
ncbi:MAG: hypothetical protein AAFX08_10310 [Pseudomonadota bacterium]